MTQPTDIRQTASLQRRARITSVILLVGCAVALAIGLSGWLPRSLWPVWILLQTWLYTGAFITAHEAMHGLAWPGRPRANRAVGRAALALYGGLPWRRLLRAHREHHAAPGTGSDPDFHANGTSFLRWYAGFLREYFDVVQFLVVALVFNGLVHGLGVPQPRALLLWVLPMVASTVQLFAVGTWLPHRIGDGFDGDGRHRARSVDLPPLASLIACFHFGYHYEHHARPDVPWWLLPDLRRGVRVVARPLQPEIRGGG